MIRHPVSIFALLAISGLLSAGLSHAAREVLVGAKVHECRDLAHAERENCIRDAEESGRVAERQLEEIERSLRHETSMPPIDDRF